MSRNRGGMRGRLPRSRRGSDMAERPEEGPAQPTVSPDGKYVWDGHNWVPAAAPHPEGSRRPVEGENAPPPAPVATRAARTQYAMPGGVRVAQGSAKLP